MAKLKHIDHIIGATVISGSLAATDAVSFGSTVAIAGQAQFSTGLYATGFPTTVAGKLIEIGVVSDKGIVQAYDRTGAAYLPLRFEGSDIQINTSSGGTISMAGDLIVTSVRRSTADGADNSYLLLSGGGAASVSRGGMMAAYGNENGSAPGTVQLLAGNVAGGAIEFYTGASALRGSISDAGAWSLPGAVAMGSTLTTANTIKVDPSGGLTDFLVLETFSGVDRILKFYIDGSSNFAMDVTNAAAAARTMTMMPSGGTLTIVGPVSLSSTLAVTGAVTLSSTTGNVGVGTTDVEAWEITNGSKALEFKGGAIYGYQSSNLILAQNAYFDGAWKYKATATTGRINFNDGSVIFDTAASGAADAGITWSQRMQVANTGQVLIGTTVTAGSAAGDLILAKGKYLKSAEGATTKYLLGLDSAGSVALGDGLNNLQLAGLGISSGGNPYGIVTTGAADSGGAGYRILRVPN